LKINPFSNLLSLEDVFSNHPTKVKMVGEDPPRKKSSKAHFPEIASYLPITKKDGQGDCFVPRDENILLW